MPFLKDPSAVPSAEEQTIEWIKKIPFPGCIHGPAEDLIREVATAARSSEDYWAIKKRIAEGVCLFSYNTTISRKFIKNFEMKLMFIMEDITSSKIGKVHE